MTSLALTIGLLLGAAIVIYLACEYFVNGVEWVGRKLAVSQQATGSILAAFGTALPESVVTFVAVTFGASTAQKEMASARRWAAPWCFPPLPTRRLASPCWPATRGCRRLRPSVMSFAG